MPKNAIKKKIKYSASEKIFYTITYTIITLLMLVVLYPLIYVVACSFSSPNAVITGKVILWPVDSAW